LSFFSSFKYCQHFTLLSCFHVFWIEIWGNSYLFFFFFFLFLGFYSLSLLFCSLWISLGIVWGLSSLVFSHLSGSVGRVCQFWGNFSVMMASSILFIHVFLPLFSFCTHNTTFLTVSHSLSILIVMVVLVPSIYLGSFYIFPSLPFFSFTLYTLSTTALSILIIVILNSWSDTSHFPAVSSS
jgi:hypothetical protein